MALTRVILVELGRKTCEWVQKKNMKIANRDTRQFFLEFCYKWGIIWTEDVKTGRVFVVVVLLGKRYYSIVYAHLDDPVASENVMKWKTNRAGIRGYGSVLGETRNCIEVWSGACIIDYI